MRAVCETRGRQRHFIRFVSYDAEHGDHPNPATVPTQTKHECVSSAAPFRAVHDEGGEWMGIVSAVIIQPPSFLEFGFFCDVNWTGLYELRAFVYGAGFLRCPLILPSVRFLIQ